MNNNETFLNKEYIIDMKLHKNDYQITVKDFMDWLLVDDFNFKGFLKSLANNNIFYTAIDFSIPVIMVKYFKRMWSI